MKHPRIKICGICRPADAVRAIQLGADYIGVIFADGPRRATIDEACAIRQATPGAKLVGVFLDAPQEEVEDTARQCRLDLIQLHGSESPSYCSNITARTGLPIIKAFSSASLPDTTLLSRYDTTGYFLFDLDKKHITDRPSESELEMLWRITENERKKGFRLFIAGALTLHNVRRAIQRTGAFCVDVCRGVESSPGVKDFRKLERFIQEVRS